MKIQCVLIALFAIHLSSMIAYDKNALGGFSISEDLFLYILKTLEEGSTILELGSGIATVELAKYYKMYSIEHDKAYLSLQPSKYIYAPIKNYENHRWYDIDYLKCQLPTNYDLLLIDVPTGDIGRYGFYYFLELFKTDITIIFDDANRNAELKLALDVAEKLGKPYEIYTCSDNKKFIVINGKLNN